MKKILTIVLLILVIGACKSGDIQERAECLIALDKTEYVVNEPIIIEFSTLKDNRIFGSLLNGLGKIQIFKDSELIYETEMYPVSAPKIEEGKLSFYHRISIRGPEFKASSGQYRIKATLKDWSSNEVEFRIED
jgi:hypothetical protein